MERRFEAKRSSGVLRAAAAGMLLTLVVGSGCYGGVHGVAPNADGDQESGDPDGMGESDPDAPEASCTLATPRIWKLTPEQYEHTVAALIPGAGGFGPRLHQVLGDTPGFSNRADVLNLSQPHVEELMRLSAELAELALADESRLPCPLDQMGSASCVDSFIDQFGREAFRRPIEGDEHAALSEFFAEQAARYGTSVALHQLVRSVLMSTDFLFRSERGEPTGIGEQTRLTPHEIASAISYLVTDGPPDDELIAAAEADALASPAQIEAHVRRLLADDGQAGGLAQFFREYARLSELDGLTKSAEAYPNWSPALAAALQRETEQFVHRVLWEEGASFEALHTFAGARVDAEIAEFFGLPDASSADVDALPDGRIGYLSRPALMARLAREDESDIIRRGHYIRETILCQSLPSPPGDVDAFPPAPDPNSTHRERLLEHSENPACASCHELMDPLAFGLEIYDGTGAHRTEDNGLPIDTTGTIHQVDGGPVAVDDAAALSRWIAGSAEARACFVDQLLDYGIGRRVNAQDECWAGDLRASFQQGDGDIVELIVELVTSEDFVLRNP